MRPIDADALKDKVLKWMPSDPCGIAEKEHPIETDIVVSLLMEIDEAPSIKVSENAISREWIPCNERMPEVDGKYLCCWQGKSVETGMFLNGHFRLYGEIKDRLVTAWMPLPEPYREEE